MTKIEWCARPGTTPETWNPVTGCTKISAGCANCYAERMARRLAGRYGYPEAPHHFDVTLRPDRLEEPLRWRKPRTVFVCSMGDLFHEDVPDGFIADVWQVMLKSPRHTFLVLTKRAKRMRHWVRLHYGQFDASYTAPPQSVWLGVTAENQEQADKRIPYLLDTPATVRFVSVEPMLGPMVIEPLLTRKLHWILLGGESGHNARPFMAKWALDVIEQCRVAGAAVFVKQLGSQAARSTGRRSKMSDPSEWVEELQVREWPQ